jgi:glycosyltransferase involved in cell wall biosynthesis
MPAVIVSHPHVAAFATGVAAGLERARMLSAYFTGVAVARDAFSSKVVSRLSTRFPVATNRIVDEVPSRALHSLPLVELGARGVAQLAHRLGKRPSVYDAIFTAHDRAVSLLRWPKEATGVYAYEDGALETFRRAQRRGLNRIWDLPLPHYLTIEDLFRTEAARWPAAVDGPAPVEPDWKKQRKDGELALATQVSVASRFTRRSLERLDRMPPVVTTPYGFPVDSFEPRPAAPSGRFTVLSVGTHNLRKGTPYLLEAWKRAEIPDAELHLIGPLKLASAFLDPYRRYFRHTPHAAKADLPRHYWGADLLAFPTLGDGFGLVIQEAMCSGTPVLTTECGGGPECITDGTDGWLVPSRDIDALVARLREAAQSRDRLFEMGKAARKRAESWTWRDAGDALSRQLRA